MLVYLIVLSLLLQGPSGSEPEKAGRERPRVKESSLVDASASLTRAGLARLGRMCKAWGRGSRGSDGGDGARTACLVRKRLKGKRKVAPLVAACDGGTAAMCNALGFMLDRGLMGKKEPDKARLAFSLACSLGSGRGCTNLGLLYKYGRGGVVEQAKAKAAFRRGCDLKTGDACSELGLTDLPESRGRSDTRQAFIMFKKACKLKGSTAGCNNLAIMWKTGAVRSDDPGRADSLFAGACKAGSTMACANKRWVTKTVKTPPPAGASKAVRMGDAGYNAIRPALRAYENVRYEQAAEMFRVLARDPKISLPYRQRAEFWLGKSLYHLKDYRGCLEVFKGIAKRGKGHPYFTDIAIWVLSVNNKLGDEAGPTLALFPVHVAFMPRYKMIRSLLLYRIGQYLLRSGIPSETKKGLDYLAHIPATARIFLKARCAQVEVGL